MDIQDVLMVSATLVGSLGGGGAIVVGFSSWLGKVWASRLMEGERARHERDLAQLRAEVRSKYEKQLELIKSELGKSVYVHRVQFETEFTAYREIWKKLVEVKKAVLSLRPVWDSIDPNEDEESRKRRRLEAFDCAFNPFFQTIDENRPFYPQEVWKELKELATLMHHEAIGYQHNTSAKVEYWKEAMENSSKIMAKIDVVENAIRHRLASLTVIDAEWITMQSTETTDLAESRVMA